MSGKLVVCPTPIGNLGDVTQRVLETLRTADLIACEDTRRTGSLLRHFEITAKLISNHEHNERGRATELLRRIGDGEIVALVSDAGMPLVSDPGYVLVRECIEAGLAVEVLPGASAVLVALAVSGLPSDRWRFGGFLPRKPGELEAAFASAETTVAFESPQRLAGSLAALAEIDPERPVAVCRELTKLHEEVRRGPAAELAEHYAQTPARGEIVLVIGGAPVGPGTDLEPALAALRKLIEAGAKPRPAAGVVAELTGLSANKLYRALTG